MLAYDLAGRPYTLVRGRTTHRRSLDGRLLLSDPARSTFWLLSAQGQPTGQFAYAGQLDLPTGIAAPFTTPEPGRLL